MHGTQRRTVVNDLKLISSASFLLFFNNLSDNLCGRLLIDLIEKHFFNFEVLIGAN